MVVFRNLIQKNHDNTQWRQEPSMWKQVSCSVEFTNIKCTSLDKKFTDFDYCYLRSINRTYKYLSIKAKLFQKPVTNASVRWTVLRKTNGYKPFLIDLTFDVCDFFKSHKDSLSRLTYSFFRDYSNLNHTCPYDHDVIIEKLDTNFMNSKLSALPINLPTGEYAFFSTWMAFNIPRVDVKVYYKIFK
ncbi:uncharacterized protein LOC119674797 [Teleopsis dalmanni]|uniref:uncharacterized protein LOC119674797 n=1 Tax=Teleopsis dalmanni TaxID=139649 RepID=UPI0018CD0AFA|nr:uncharacterized protein LOC119674797 [Teleopsis dalmanni]